MWRAMQAAEVSAVKPTQDLIRERAEFYKQRAKEAPGG